MSRNLLIRIAVAAVAIPVILWISYTGGVWLFGMVTLFAGVGLFELLLNERVRPGQLRFWFPLVALSAGLIAAYATIPQHSVKFSVPFWTCLGPIFILYFLVTSMLAAIGKKTPDELYADHARLFWGTFYLGALYPFVYALGADSSLDQIIAPSSKGDLLLFLFGVLWVGDTAAMGFGKWMGRHKLAPGVSPNKTVEGFIGGLLGGAAIGLLMFFWKFPQLPIGHVLLIAVGCSLFGQLGDLVESMWKRSLGIKDSSGIIPGHGGVLDRFDSLLFAAPFMYVYITWIL